MTSPRAALLLLVPVLLLSACGGPSTEKPVKTTTAVLGPTELPDIDPASQSALPPSGFPGPTTQAPPPSGVKEQRFLEELRKAGLAVSANGETELPVAAWVCDAKHTGSSEQDIRTYVVAYAGLTGAQSPDSLADAWIKIAIQYYC